MKVKHRKLDHLDNALLLITIRMKLENSAYLLINTSLYFQIFSAANLWY